MRTIDRHTAGFRARNSIVNPFHFAFFPPSLDLRPRAGAPVVGCLNPTSKGVCRLWTRVDELLAGLFVTLLCDWLKGLPAQVYVGRLQHGRPVSYNQVCTGTGTSCEIGCSAALLLFHVAFAMSRNS